ncbi:MAG: TRAP transporter substrate-binding protein [Alphaproteobacteria bacterium]|nr:TRAP transporter substrate-binding protein [Alphaproteobacteria bacterium]
MIRLAAVALLGAVLAAGPAFAQKKEFRYATSAPPGTPWEKQINEYRANVQKHSNGQIDIVPYLNSVLGSETEVIGQVQRGRVDMGGFSITAGATVVPELALLAAPYIWDSEKQLDCVLDNHLAQPFFDMFAKKGMYFVGWAEAGWVIVGGKKPLITPDDVRGYKVRTAPSKASAAFWSAMGANGVPLAVTEINSSLQTGMVDGVDVPITTFVAGGVGRLAPHAVLTRHTNLASVVVINKRLYDGLSAEQKKALENANTPPEQLRREVRGMEMFLLGKHKEGGGQVHALTPDQLGEWKKRASATHPDLVREIGGEAQQIFERIQRGKAACPVS